VIPKEVCERCEDLWAANRLSSRTA
jgi:hypothetical protein